jgi:hypothetical protein
VLSTQLFSRLVRLVTRASGCCVWLRPSGMDSLFDEAGVDPSTERFYTLAQLLCYLVCLTFFIVAVVTGTSIDLAVGLVIVAIVQPLRETYVKPRLTPSQLRALDTLRLDANLGGAVSAPSERTKLMGV